MARQYKTGLIITGDAKGGIRAIQATEKELGQLNKGFDRSSKRSRQFAANAGGVSKELSVLRRAAAPVGAALAGMFAANTLRQQIDFADQLQKTNLRIGASTEALSQYNYVASLSGVQFKELATAWQRQSRRVAQAAQDTGEAQEALATLNLDAKALAQLAPEKQFERIAGAMNGVANEAQRVALAQKIWDSEGVKLLQIVNQGTDAISRMRAEADALGLTISQQTANDMASFNDEMSRFSFAARGVSTSLLAEVVPALTDSMQAANGFISALRSGELEGVATTLNVTAGAAAGVASAYLTVRGSLAAATAAQWAFNTAVRANPLMLLVGTASAVAGALIMTRDNMSEVERQANQTAEEVRGLAQGFQFLNQEQQKNAKLDVIKQLTEWRLAAGELGAELVELQELQRQSGQLDKHGGAQEIITSEQLARGREARRELAALMTQIGAGAETLKDMDRILEESGGSGGGLASLEAGADAAEEQAKALESLRQSMDPLRADHADYKERLDVLNKALAEGAVTQLEYAEGVRWAAEQYTDAATGAEEYQERVESLVGEYDRHHQQAAALEADLDAINEAYRRGDIDGEQYQRMIAGVKEGMRELALESDPLAQDMAKAWEEAANRIDETFADAFTGAFDSFDDFASQLEDGFKRLLAELAYQATLRPIVVGFTQDMQGMMGIGGAQAQGLSGTSGGFDNLLSTGKQLYNGFANGFGNIAWGGASNTAYAGTGFANSATSGIGQSGFMGGSTANFSGMTGLASAGAGYLGGKAGQAVWGDDRANSNYGQMAGAAIGTYFGGPIGAGIGSFLGSGVDQLFGSDRDSYGQIGQELDAEVDAHGVYRYDRLDKYQNYARDSAFGTIGITKKQKTDDDALKRMVKQFVEIDNAVAAVMTASQLEETQQALDGWKSSRTENIGSIVGQRLNAVSSAADTPFTASLKRLSGDDLVQGLIAGLQIENAGASMARAVAQDMNSEFRDALRGGDDISAATQSIMTAANAVNLMADSAGRLNLEFDATVKGALAAADDLQEMAGGVGALSSQQQAYYQAFFSDQERFAQVTENLNERFDDLNMAMPDTDEAFRDLVEAQNLMSEAGREQYASLMQLVPTMSQYLDVMERQRSQLQDWVDSLLLSDQSTLDPGERLQESQSQYASLLVQAENGNGDAMGNLGNVAQQYLNEAAGYYGQASDQYGTLFDEILDAARGLGVEIDGSHANGIANVPFDGYRAELHRGEDVLPAPIAKLYREGAPGGQRDGELLRELQAMRREAEALRNEVRQLRGERGQDADRAAAQRDRQLREQRDISRNTRTPVATV